MSRQIKKKSEEEARPAVAACSGLLHLTSKLRSRFSHLEISLEEKFDDAGLLVNATSLGLHATDAMPMDPGKLPGNCAVLNIIAARRTEFMAAAAPRGLKVVDAVAMTKYQLRFKPRFGEAKNDQRYFHSPQ